MVAAKSGASIGFSDPRLLKRLLPALHLEGSTATVMESLARSAGVALTRTGPKGWRITPQAVTAEAPAPTPVAPPASSVAPLVVQASKRNQRLADYPAELVTVSSEALGRYGAAPDTAALIANVPILTSTDWGAGHEKLFLRAIADSSFTGTRPTLVGEYLGDQSLTSDAPDPDLRLYDIASVEVLAGPQGTLYGAGALAGLIRIEPKAPALNDFGGSMWLGGSSTAHGANGGDVGGVLNIPLVEDRLALRVVGYGAQDGGYIDDLERGLNNVNRVDTRGGRVALRWTPGGDWTIDLGGVAQRIDSRDAAYTDPGEPPLTRSSSIAQPAYDLFLSGNLTVAGRIGGVDVRSTTGVVRQSLGEQFEASLIGHTAVQFNDDEAPEQMTQEVRLSGSSRTTSWVLGASYLARWETLGRDYGSVGDPASIAALHDRTSELTGYGEVSQKITGGISATVGLRYAMERQTGGGVSGQGLNRLVGGVQTSIDADERHLLPSVALTYQLAPGATLFVRDGSGFRSGGLTPSSMVERYASDRITTVEVGVRRSALGADRIAVSLTGAYSQWRDIQADVLNGIGLPEIANIGDGRVYSLDAATAVKIVEGLSFTASGFLASSRLDPSPTLVQPGADSLPDVARNGDAASLDYQGRLGETRSWKAGVRVQHIGPSVVGAGRLDRLQGDYTTVAFGGGVRFGATNLLLNISNLLDSHAQAFAIGAPVGALLDSEVTPIRPRTIRIGLQYDF